MAKYLSGNIIDNNHLLATFHILGEKGNVIMLSIYNWQYKFIMYCMLSELLNRSSPR